MRLRFGSINARYSSVSAGGCELVQTLPIDIAVLPCRRVPPCCTDQSKLAVRMKQMCKRSCKVVNIFPSFSTQPGKHTARVRPDTDQDTWPLHGRLKRCSNDQRSGPCAGYRATYLTSFCVHARSLCTSFATFMPCANLARVFASRALA